MKAVWIDGPTGLKGVRINEVPETRPAGSQVLIRLRASGVNFADILCREGSHPGMATYPLILGCEGAGTVEGIGSDSSRFKVGDRVAVYAPMGGTYAESMVAPEEYVLPIPETMSFQQAAAFTHVFLTAYHALITLGAARAGEWVAITAAGGGVGTALVQLAQVLKLQIIGGVGSNDKFSVLEELGVHHRVNYRSESLSSYVLKTSRGSGAHLVLDSVGGPLFDEALSSMAPLGRFVLFGISSGKPQGVHPYDLLPRCASFCTLNLSVIFSAAPQLVLPSWNRLIELFLAGRVGPLIHHQFPLEQAAAAQELMESRKSTGKIILTIGDS